MKLEHTQHIETIQNKKYQKIIFKGKIVSYIALKEDCFSIAHEFLLLIATFFFKCFGGKENGLCRTKQRSFCVGSQNCLEKSCGKWWFLPGEVIISVQATFYDLEWWFFKRSLMNSHTFSSKIKNNSLKNSKKKFCWIFGFKSYFFVELLG